MYKKITVLMLSSLVFVACGVKPNSSKAVDVSIDLTDADHDMLTVVHNPGKIKKESIRFYIPKTVPGTYDINDYGQFVQEMTAYDYSGNTMAVVQEDENTWTINNAKNLDKVSYKVNDTYDEKGEGGVFSPAGTNIEEGENYMLNLHGFVGYFEGYKEETHQLKITRPIDMDGASSLQIASRDTLDQKVTDAYVTSRYFGLIDNPMMYGNLDKTTFDIQGMKVEFSVYSPNSTYTAEDLKPGLEKMVQAQKSFLGKIDNTPLYSIILYLSDMEKTDARGFGALEHHTSTTVVLPETMPLDDLEETMTDVVSHEFFHIITPLNLQSEEVHYFDYNTPKMSQHLWLYEGVTEYFANLFQVNQGLISEQDFYDRMAEKIQTSKGFNDELAFTELSEHILTDDYKEQYYNFYLKGALIGMTLDIKLRELSNGDQGILKTLKTLIDKYGKDKPFKDEKLISEMVKVTYPEIQDYFDTYVTGTTPIPYEEFFDKVGLTYVKKEKKTGYFMDGQTPFIDVNTKNNTLFFRKAYPLNSTLKTLGVEPGDVLKSVNGKDYALHNVRALMNASYRWKTGEDLTMLVERDGEEVELSGEVTQPTMTSYELEEKTLSEDSEAYKLREAWLKS